MASDSTGWPLLEERVPLGRVRRSSPRRRSGSRSTWLLAVLAFLCGGLVSAAVFTIGWRHQAQRNTAAETALAAATARNHHLASALAAARAAEERDRRVAAEARASARALARAGTAVASQASSSTSAASSVANGAGSMASAAGKLAGELKTLTTYLTTTPSSQLDPGYVASQTAYLARQVDRLQAEGGNVADAAASFDAAAAKLGRLAAALSTGN